MGVPKKETRNMEHMKELEYTSNPCYYYGSWDSRIISSRPVNVHKPNVSQAAPYEKISEAGH